METSNPFLKRVAGFGDTTAETSMNLNGTVNKTGILLLICMATAALGWTTPELRGGVLILPVLGGMAFALIGMFKPATTPYVAPLYAACEGLFLGVISQTINAKYPGIAANAVMLTFSVLGLFLFLYATRIVKVTSGMKVAVFAATGGICVFYLIDMVLSFFGHGVPLLNSSSPMGIGLSILICGIAAFNFFLDFDAIERLIRGGSPKYMEWYSGMALMIALVWLYMEILRLLMKLQNRR